MLQIKYLFMHYFQGLALFSRTSSTWAQSVFGSKGTGQGPNLIVFDSKETGGAKSSTMEYFPIYAGNPVPGNKADELVLAHPMAWRGSFGQPGLAGARRGTDGWRPDQTGAGQGADSHDANG
ncbi:hypothetical protein BDA96_08G097100 [Sorghum bicolor]|uniref:Uncharacterized protein n=1 Tax=Sorghum bicolor TaxID=4558 RepID=A0A921U728_SORBI|nr:hypothetical protein BDA96_08G097100 [Sorghum bicolor]